MNDNVKSLTHTQETNNIVIRRCTEQSAFQQIRVST